MKKIIAATTLLAILTGCTSAEYKNQMEKGSQALTEKKYEEAVSAFSSAVQEEPKKQDAKEQLALAEKAVVEFKVSEALKDGQTAMDNMNYEYAVLVLSRAETEFNNNPYVKELMDKLKDMLDEASLQDMITRGQQAIQAYQFKNAIKLLTKGTEQFSDDKQLRELLKEATDKQKIKEEVQNEALQSLIVQEDNLTGEKFYFDKFTYSIISFEYGNVYNGVYLYIRQNANGEPSLRFVSRYYDRRWIFYKSLLFRINDEVYTIDTNPKKEMSEGKVSEYEDVEVNQQILSIIKEIIDSTGDVPFDL